MMKQLTKQNRIDITQNIETAVSNLTSTMSQIITNDKCGITSLEHAKYAIDEAIKHIEGFYD